MRICAGIVLFEPDSDRLKKCIDAVLPQVDELFLADNTPGGCAEEIFSGIRDDKRIKIISNGKNLGIAAALNQLTEYARENDYKWILTLDQDSICTDQMVDTLYEAAKYCANVVMISPQIIERGKIWQDKHDKLRRNKKTPENEEPPLIEDVKHCITSGTLTNVEAIHNAGGFDERLFIDEVDRDMCIRLRYLGHRLIRANTAVMHHEFGEKLIRRRIFFKTYEYRNYSPFRVYYQTRNMIYMIRRYGADYKPHPAWRYIRPFFTFTVKFIFEPQRIARLSAFIRGYIAGFKM